MGGTSHKRIGVLYLIFSLLRGIRGLGFSILIRLEAGFKGGSLLGDGHLYNVVITAHAILIIFFMVMPGLIGGFGNWMLPLIRGVEDIVFPRINALSF